MKNTLENIDHIMENLRTHPEYSEKLKGEFYNALIKEANRYSMEIEQSMGNSSDKRMFSQEEKEECFSGLENARNFLRKEKITLYSLSTLGHIIAPYNHEGIPTPKGFRQTNIMFGGFEGASPESIHHRIDNLIYFINHSSNIHSIIRSGATHLELMGIQPYLDGNSRSARLLGNFLLEGRGYPPAIITEGERDHYLALRECVYKENEPILPFAKNPSIAQRTFYTFIASKVLKSAQNLDEELKKNRIYEVDLSGVEEKKVCLSLTRALKNMVKSRGRPIKTSLSNGNHKKYSIKIQGDLSKSEIESFFTKKKGRYPFKFEVTPII